jgi:hypothetical protein
MYREVLKLSAPLAESVPHLVAIFRNNHGECLTAMQRYREAEEALLQSHAVLKERFGAEHARVAKSDARLAKLYEAWGKPDKAMEHRAQGRPRE